MVQAKIKFASFEDYFDWSNDPENEMEGRFELVDGELVQMAPESGLNNWIATQLFLLLATSGLVSPRLVKVHACELQVPVLRPRDAANRYPDLVILQEIHWELTQKRLTITLDMPPPRLVVEVLSPGKQNRERDRIRKRDQYAARGIPEYWLIDPEMQTVTVLSLRDGVYEEIGVFQGDDSLRDGRADRVLSPSFPDLALTVGQILAK